jgi:hypothetical protein
MRDLEHDHPERDRGDDQRRQARGHLLLGHGEHADVAEDHGAHQRRGGNCRAVSPQPSGHHQPHGHHRARHQEARAGADQRRDRPGINMHG